MKCFDSDNIAGLNSVSSLAPTLKYRAFARCHLLQGVSGDCLFEQGGGGEECSGSPAK